MWDQNLKVKFKAFCFCYKCSCHEEVQTHEDECERNLGNEA